MLEHSQCQCVAMILYPLSLTGPDSHRALDNHGTKARALTFENSAETCHLRPSLDAMAAMEPEKSEHIRMPLLWESYLMTGVYDYALLRMGINTMHTLLMQLAEGSTVRFWGGSTWMMSNPRFSVCSRQLLAFLGVTYERVSPRRAFVTVYRPDIADGHLDDCAAVPASLEHRRAPSRRANILGSLRGHLQVAC